MRDLFVLKDIVLCCMLFMALSPSIVFARVQSDVVADVADVATLVQDNSAFALDLYQQLRLSPGNIFFSPHSISTALAMTYAGARGNTEKQMANAMRFSLDQERLHHAFADLESRLNKLQETGNVMLSVASSLWPQQKYKFREEYLSLITRCYGASIFPVDYEHAYKEARKMINRWVEDKTRDKIKDIVGPGVLDALTRLVLVNAIYFKGTWENRFRISETRDAPFFLSPEGSVQTRMMRQKEEFGYADLGSLEMLELPYAGTDLAMLVLLPKETDGLRQLETILSIENLNQWKARLRKREVVVFLPKFRMTSEFRLDKRLVSMGMVDAFNDARANFAGMDGRNDWLYIAAVIHKAFVDVNEEGTEAAAATAVVMRAKSMPTPPPVFRADHPFLFLIQETRTGTILFVGRLADPAKTGE
jgi:serpin B